MRKMPHTTQPQTPISIREVALQPLRLARRIAAIRRSLDHQRRRRQRLHLTQPSLARIVSRIPRLSRKPPRSIRIQRDRSPIRIQEALRRPRKLRLFEPPRRTPRLPLHMREPHRIGPHLLRSRLHAHQPLIPEPSRLIERRHPKHPRGWYASAKAAIAVTRSGNSAANVYAALAPQSCPTTANRSRPSAFAKIDRILRQRHTRTHPRRLLPQKSRRTRPAQIRRHRPPALRLQSRRNQVPAARRIRPPMQQNHRSAIPGTTFLEADLQQLRPNCPHRHVSSPPETVNLCNMNSPFL